MEAKLAPEPRMEARTEPKKQVENQNGSENGRIWRSGRQTGNNTETEAEDEAYLVPEVGITTLNPFQNPEPFKRLLNQAQNS